MAGERAGVWGSVLSAAFAFAVLDDKDEGFHEGRPLCTEETLKEYPDHGTEKHDNEYDKYKLNGFHLVNSHYLLFAMI